MAVAQVRKAQLRGISKKGLYRGMLSAVAQVRLTACNLAVGAGAPNDGARALACPCRHFERGGDEQCGGKGTLHYCLQATKGGRYLHGRQFRIDVDEINA